MPEAPGHFRNKEPIVVTRSEVTDPRLLPCPKCGSLSTRPIAYGPLPQGLEAPLKHGLLTYGGDHPNDSSATRECLVCETTFQDRVPQTRRQFVESSLILLESFKKHWELLVIDYGIEREMNGDPSRIDDHHGHNSLTLICRLWSLLEATAQPFCHSFITRRHVPFYGAQSVDGRRQPFSLVPYETALLRNPGKDPHFVRCDKCGSYATIPAISHVPDLEGGSRLWKRVESSNQPIANCYCCNCTYEWRSSAALPVTADCLWDPLIVLFHKSRGGIDRSVKEYGDACALYAMTPADSDERRAAHLRKMHTFAKAVRKWEKLFDSLRNWGYRQPHAF